MEVKYKEHEEAISMSKAPRGVTDLEEELKEERVHTRELEKLEEEMETLKEFKQFRERLGALERIGQQ